MRSPLAMAASHPDFTTKDSPLPVVQAVERLTTLMTKRGMTIFATIDQRAAARSAGLGLRESVLVIFRNPAAGTPVMDAVPLVALDSRRSCSSGRRGPDASDLPEPTALAAPTRCHPRSRRHSLALIS